MMVDHTEERRKGPYWDIAQVLLMQAKIMGTCPLDWYEFKSLLQSVSCFDFSQYKCWKKHTLNPEITILYQFHDQKALFKVPKTCNIDF